MEGLLGELDRAATAPLDDGELLRARSSVLSKQGTNGSAISGLLQVAAYNLPRDATAARAEATFRVEAADVARVAGVYLAGRRRVVTIVGDARRVVPALHARGMGVVQDPR